MLKLDGLRSGVLKHVITILVKLLQAEHNTNDNLFNQIDRHLDNIEGAKIVPYVEGKTLKFKVLPTVK